MLIVGCGSALRGDDGVGPTTIERLRERAPEGATLIDAGTNGFDIVELARGATHVVIVDAARAAPGAATEPGRLHHLDDAAVGLLTAAAMTDLHDFRWEQALALLRTLHPDEYPGRIEAYLVEGARFAVGAPMSPEVDAAVDALVALLCTSRP